MCVVRTLKLCRFGLWRLLLVNNESGTNDSRGGSGIIRDCGENDNAN